MTRLRLFTCFLNVHQLILHFTNIVQFQHTTMSAAGPELPPHLLAKRKRQAEEAPENHDTAASGANRSRSPTGEDKRQRVLGPAPPPAPLNERPAEPAQEEDDDDDDSSSSDSDDGFGPALPSASDNHQDDAPSHAKPTPSTSAPPKTQRDEWMMVPPKQDDLAARMDPSKVRARGFNTGKAARPAAAGGTDTAWTETPEEKLKRLQDEAMGVDTKTAPGSAGFDAKVYEKNKEKEERARRIREHTVRPFHRALTGIELTWCAGKDKGRVVVGSASDDKARGEGGRSKQTCFRQGKRHGPRWKAWECRKEGDVEQGRQLLFQICWRELSLSRIQRNRQSHKTRQHHNR